MSELKPTEKGYIEALAVIEYPKQSIYDTERIKYAEFTAPRREGFNKGYTLALEHNNVPELIEAAWDIVKYAYTEDSHNRLVAALTKAEQNKLNK